MKEQDKVTAYGRSPGTGLICCLLAAAITLSGCLTRKNALPPKESILTDASSAPKRVRPGKQLLDSYASVLGVSINELQHPALYAFINNWMGVPHRTGGTDHRSEEHTSELQSLMRSPYAVFCLKKK